MYVYIYIQSLFVDRNENHLMRVLKRRIPICTTG